MTSQRSPNFKLCQYESLCLKKKINFITAAKIVATNLIATEIIIMTTVTELKLNSQIKADDAFLTLHKAKLIFTCRFVPRQG